MKFKYYTIIEKITGGGVARKEVDISINVIRDELLAHYKKKVNIHQTHIIVKLDDYIKTANIWRIDLEELKKINVKYAIIQEWEESTPHGNYDRASYEGEATEQDYKVEKALNVICDLIEDKT